MLEPRIGAAIILINNQDSTEALNRVISDYAYLVIGRQGIPLRERGFSVISLVLEGTTDELGALTGKIGRIPGIQIKSVLTQ